MIAPLKDALEQRSREYMAALDLLEGLIDDDAGDDNPAWGAIWTLKEAIEVARCARRLLEGRTVREVHAAFGAPGDFGYETAVGAALSTIYRRPRSAGEP